MITYRYSRWDGSQDIPDIDAESLMEALSDDLISYSDLESALNKLLERGMKGDLGRRMKGLSELLRRLYEKRQEILKKYNLSSIMEDLEERLKKIKQTERQGIMKKLDEAYEQYLRTEDDTDLLKHKAMQRMAEQNLAFLDQLPKDLGGAVNKLMEYAFVDGSARSQFEELLDILKQAVTETSFEGLSERLKDMKDNRLDEFKQMLDALNQMMREKRQGKRPDFQDFMKKNSSFFGSNPPKDLEELIEQLQRNLSKIQSLLSSLKDEKKKELEDMINSALQQEGLRQSLEELANHLEHFMPSRSMRTSYPFEGQENLSLSEALKLMEQLQDMDQLRKQLSSMHSFNSLKEIDQEKVKDLLGEESYQSLLLMQKVVDTLEEAGYVYRRGDRIELTPMAMRRIGQKALRDIFSIMKKEGTGKHRIPRSGSGGEIIEGTKKYEFGDPFFLDIKKTLENALLREGPSLPLKLHPSDFEVYQTEDLNRCATALLLDLSWSMFLRGRFPAAKRVALALDSLIRTQYPRDTLYLIAFSEYAWQIKSAFLPYADRNEYVYGTNMHHGFMLARKLLSKHKSVNRQIIIVTDGEPTAHLENGISYFEYPPSPRTLELTIQEARHCAKEKIVINVFMLDKSYHLTEFVNMLTKVNKGRVFFTNPEKLGEYLLVDYVTHRRKRIVL